MEKKLGGNYARMLQAILNKSWRQHPKKQQMYGHLPPITKTIKNKRTRHSGEVGARASSSNCISLLIRYVALRTCLNLWRIGRGGERGSGISVLMAWHDDDDDDLPLVGNTHKEIIIIIIIIISGGNTKSKWCSWYSHQSISTRTGWLGNKRTSGDHQKLQRYWDQPGYWGESSAQKGDLMGFVVTQIPDEKLSAKGGVKNSKSSKW